MYILSRILSRIDLSRLRDTKKIIHFNSNLPPLISRYPPHKKETVTLFQVVKLDEMNLENVVLHSISTF